MTNLSIINDPQAPQTYVQDEIKGRPDLTLLGKDIILFIDSWQVDDHLNSFSDHKYIRFTTNLSPIIKNDTRYKTKFAPLGKFNSLIKQQETELLGNFLEAKNIDDVDQWAEKFPKLIQDTMNES